MSDPSWTDYTTAIGTAAGAVATAVTAGIAWYAAATWRKSLSHASQHDIAKDVLEAARLFRYLFYDTRNPFYAAPEFPADYHTVSDAGLSISLHSRLKTRSRYQVILIFSPKISNHSDKGYDNDPRSQ